MSQQPLDPFNGLIEGYSKNYLFPRNRDHIRLERNQIEQAHFFPGALEDVGSSDLMILIGGVNPKNNSRTDIGKGVCLYDMKQRWWSCLPSLPEPRCHHVAVLTKGDVYVIGGFDYSNSKKVIVSNATFKLSHHTWKWRRMSDLNSPRACHGGVVTDLGSIVVVGGRDNRATIFSSLEEYVPGTDQWTYLTSMDRPKMAMGVAFLKGELWVLGGISTSDTPDEYAVPVILDHVASFSPVTGEWCQRPPMSYPKAYCSAIAYRNEIWVWGGLRSSTQYNQEVLVSSAEVEVFSPMTACWGLRCHTRVPRHGAALVVCDNTIFCLGGMSTQRNGATAQR